MRRIHNYSDSVTVVIRDDYNPPACACQIYYGLIILSVKTLHTLVFFCKFQLAIAFWKKTQHIKNTTNNGKKQQGCLQKTKFF